MQSISPLWTILLVLACCSGYCAAFGAGNIPSFAFLEGRAFRHGDIDDILADLLIRAAVAGATTSLSGFAQKHAGKKFSGLNVKRTYFGNWLRDYSQAVDVGTLSRGLDVATIRVLVWVFGFLSFGYSTQEFEVTAEKLGVYRPEEHIDNPKDYADNIDARQLDPRLRGPVDPRELAVDPRTGMKNYIANEQGGWTTSTRYIRESLFKAIDLGRHASTDEDRYEALRLLGQSLHTLEDLSAHSNWVELTLIEMGYKEVFPHVGRNTQVQILGTGKYVWPLVTGTFGGMDFIHSLLGEASDHISQTSVSELQAAITDAQRQNAQELFDKLKLLMKMFPSGHNDLESLQQNSQSLGSQGNVYHLSGTQGEGIAITAQEIAKQIYPILALRDKIMKTVETAIDHIPGLRTTYEDIKTTLTLCVLSVIQPLIRPIIRVVTEKVTQSSALVMTDHAQYLVWSDDNSSDPTHSMLSKDHFSCYLNEPAGQVAKVIVRYAVNQVVTAWSSEAVDPRAAINSILQCFCHPALLNTASQLHQDMFNAVKGWVDRLPHEKRVRVFDGLTREGVRQGKHHDDEVAKVELTASVQGQYQSSHSITNAIGGYISSTTAATTYVGSSREVDTVSTYPSGTSQSYYQSSGYGARGYQPSTSYGSITRSDTFRTDPEIAYRRESKKAPTRQWPYNTDFYSDGDPERGDDPYQGAVVHRRDPRSVVPWYSYRLQDLYVPQRSTWQNSYREYSLPESFQNLSIRDDYSSRDGYYHQS